ncbi:hypothetical protein SNE40_003609 [Patella caerulea]|uniref:Neurotransmitter-gated ion-channel ligand-binding domain-containing protein n=1 Tax=Patella caerulea TaxID=87958 RepID=A0AAN8Q101_PATCE
MKTEILFCALLLLAAQASSQRRELEADIKAVANAATEVISDNPDETTFVKIELMLQNIINYDPKSQILEITAWLLIQWTDSRFAWKPSHYGNITKISIPSSGVTKPDIKLYNSVKSGMIFDDNVNCVIESNGKVTYIPITDMKVYCPNTDPTDDTYVCSLKFGSWAHNCHDLNLTRVDDMIDMSEFQGGWRWHILEHSSEVHEKQYDCCPEVYCDATMKFKFRDRSRTPRGRWYYSHCY